MSILKLIGSFLIEAFKAFFWSDKPQVHEVKDAPATKATIDSDESLIADLRGLRGEFRESDADGVHHSEAGTPSASSGEQAAEDAT